jgi:16S rRNA (uracil1498-N3)-methyltransferase
MARRRFFVDAVERGHARITGPDAYHLTRVLRVEPGEQFEISDNRAVYLAEVESARKDLVSFSVRETVTVSEPRVYTAVLASLIRFERMEWMIEKATELGVARIVPVEAERSEKGLEKAARKRLPRWNRIAREASEQSRRAHLPEIAEPVDLSEALHCEGDYRFVLEEAQAPAFLSVLPAGRPAGARVAVLVGPEGGWTDRERQRIGLAGWRAVSLGREILRAETAAIAALAIVNGAWESSPNDSGRSL